MDLTEEEKAELQKRNQARIEKFATAVQEENFAPRDLRSLKNADQRDVFPLLSQSLENKELTPSQYKQLMQYLGKNPRFIQYEKALQSIIKRGGFGDLITFFENGFA